MALPPQECAEESYEFDSSSEALDSSASGLPDKEEGEEEEEEEEENGDLFTFEEVLCAERVGQMTKTYNDIDAVTRLLEEKERDLELAARIGQSLLKKNKTLSERNEYLEEQVEHIREEVSQLRHDLSMKDELLQFYTSVAEECEGDSATSTPVRRNESTALLPGGFPLDSLQKKLKDLEEENISLRTEANHLETETMCYEEKEQQLVNDCVKELRDANFQLSSLAEELARKTDDASRQQEEITHLLSQIVDLQKKSKAYAVENEELTQHLGAAKDAQRQLTAELRELEDKYAECLEMLNEAQEELKNLRNKTLPSAASRRFNSLGLFPMDSLAAEIEGTMRKELQMDDPDVEEHMLHPKRIFQTVRNVNQTVRQRSTGPSPMNIPGSNQTSSLNSRRSSCVSTPRSSMYGGSMMDNRASSMILEGHTPEDRSDDSNRKQAGTPGTPGSQDLAAALRRLTLRRDNYMSERRFFEDERERKLQELSEKDGLSEGRGGEDGSLTPTDSIMSLGLSSLHSGLSGFSFYGPRSYLPEKLQIVKPLEGSVTLHQWQQLAQPNLGGILDPRPGVVTKGFRPLELDLEEVYRFTDLEEDEAGGERLSITGLTASGHLSRRRLCLSRCSSTSSLASDNNNTLPNNNTMPNNNTPINNNNNNDFSGSSDGLDQEPSAAAAAAAAGTGNGQVSTGSLEMAEAAGLSSVHLPGKCQSHTTSTYTITTCRIMHPSDELTRVTPSVMSGPTTSCVSTSSASCVSTSSASCVTTSSILRCSSRPASTPCTPRRLSLAESFTNLRDSTKTTSTSLGLVRMMQECGISAAVYDPWSWDRVAASAPADYANPKPSPNPAERALCQDSRHGPDTLPSTPPTPPPEPNAEEAPLQTRLLTTAPRPRPTTTS
ncbi:trafficking kinesin-binding protein 1 isoform X2 [Clupea harengus]|uniref:Trafficking kinesin-binding protein 1 isoform X2 n=1 Tax=Clupea harengus TaxID=7950 RepID=A0A6P8GAH9_CLUHA|nr:trafficking kinesin-binding protein 1 isoform X2 [Clupea harengus]